MFNSYSSSHSHDPVPALSAVRIKPACMDIPVFVSKYFHRTLVHKNMKIQPFLILQIKITPTHSMIPLI